MNYVVPTTCLVLSAWLFNAFFTRLHSQSRYEAPSPLSAPPPMAHAYGPRVHADSSSSAAQSTETAANRQPNKSFPWRPTPNLGVVAFWHGRATDGYGSFRMFQGMVDKNDKKC